jgi:hypothetical protein
MARDDDEEDRPRKSKRSSDEDVDEVDEIDEDDEDDRPRKKRSSRDEDEAAGKGPKPLPPQVLAPAIASMGWGFLTLHGGCLSSAASVHGLMELRNFQHNMGGMVVHGGQGLLIVMALTHVGLLLLAALLLAGGALLLLRKPFAKYLAMGAPVGMVLVALGGFVVGMIMTGGSFLGIHFNSFIVNMIFSLAVAGCNVVLLMHKNVAKALK